MYKLYTASLSIQHINGKKKFLPDLLQLVNLVILEGLMHASIVRDHLNQETQKAFSVTGSHISTG